MAAAKVDDDEYEVPLRDQRFFGAGIKRKRVHFVPSTSTDVALETCRPNNKASTAASRYLSIVMKQGDVPPGATETALPKTTSLAQSTDSPILSELDTTTSDEERSLALCDICHRTVQAGEIAAGHHESSIAHQICLQHSHPPSHVDRRRKGLGVLERHGWDPDSRLGLGAEGEGMLHPIKAKENPARAGLGVKFDLKAKVAETKPVKLDAGRVRLGQAEARKKAESLQKAFSRSEEVERYLGSLDGSSANVDREAFRRAKKGM